jgi:hypothetical protein
MMFLLMNAESVNQGIVERQLRGEVERLLPMVTRAEKYYLARGELVDPTSWADSLQEEDEKLLAQQIWEAHLQSEIAQVVNEFYPDGFWPHGLEYLEALTEYSRRVNQVLGEWRNRWPVFRYHGDFVYWVQPSARRLAEALGPGPNDFRVKRLTLVAFVAFAIDNRKHLFDLESAQRERKVAFRFFKRALYVEVWGLTLWAITWSSRVKGSYFVLPWWQSFALSLVPMLAFTLAVGCTWVLTKLSDR